MRAPKIKKDSKDENLLKHTIKLVNSVILVME